MKAKNGKILFSNGIELNLETGETVERFFFLPKEKEEIDKGGLISKELILRIVKREGMFSY